MDGYGWYDGNSGMSVVGWNWDIVLESTSSGMKGSVPLEQGGQGVSVRDGPSGKGCGPKSLERVWGWTRVREVLRLRVKPRVQRRGGRVCIEVGLGMLTSSRPA